MRVLIPDFESREELFKHLVENKAKMIAQKCKFDIESEVVKSGTTFMHTDFDTEKSSGSAKKDEIQVKVVMNTTSIMDSHGDVHIPGIWDKTLKENKSFYHLQEHKRTFDAVIDDNAKAYVQDMTWKELGYEWEGKTQALVFESTVSKELNDAMFKAYSGKRVKNHSVGMRYVKLELAINSDKPDFKAEKAVWDQYYPIVANKEEAEKQGYFWAVKEAKLNEGSAVLFGSNYATPTLETKEYTEDEPEKSTQPQPDLTALKESLLNLQKTIK